MSHFRPVELRHASRLLNHGPTVLITSRDETRTGVTLWLPRGRCRLSLNHRVSPLWWIKARSRELIERSRQFGIVIPGVSAANWTYAVGNVSGRDEDKFNCYGIPVVNGPALGLPVIEDVWRGWSAGYYPLHPRQKSTIRYSGKWFQPPPMSARLSPDAGCLTGIS